MRNFFEIDRKAGETDRNRRTDAEEERLERSRKLARRLRAGDEDVSGEGLRDLLKDEA